METVTRSSSYIPDVRRPLPAALDEEKSLIGSMMMAPGKVIPELILQGYTAAAFHHPEHSTIFELLTGMWIAQLPIDLVSVTTRLDEQKLLEQVGGAAAVTDFFTFVPTASNWSYYAEKIKERWSARQAIIIAAELTEAAYDPARAGDIPRIAQEALVKMAGLYESKAETLKLKDIILETINHIEDVIGGRAPAGLMTGIPGLDKALRGLKPGQMVVIAAQTKRGKTTLAMNIAEAVASAGNAVGIFSLEMSRLELGKKLLTAKAKVDLSQISERPLETGEMRRLMLAADELCKLNVHVRDESVVTAFEFQSAARKLVAKEKCKLLVVDYLQLFTPGAEEKNRERQVANCSRVVKTTAADMGVPIIVLSQLNTADEARESKAIEMDANIFMIIEEVPETKTERVNGKNTDVTLRDAEGNDIVNHWIWIKYGRDIGSGRIPVRFDKQFGIFSDKYV